MDWKELSDKAKSIIEWVEDPYTNKRRTIKIKIGEYFEPETIYAIKPTQIMVTKEIYQEIMDFVTNDRELEYELFPDRFIFKIKDDSELKLHW